MKCMNVIYPGAPPASLQDSSPSGHTCTLWPTGRAHNEPELEDTSVGVCVCDYSDRQLLKNGAHYA